MCTIAKLVVDVVVFLMRQQIYALWKIVASDGKWEGWRVNLTIGVQHFSAVLAYLYVVSSFVFCWFLERLLWIR